MEIPTVEEMFDELFLPGEFEDWTMGLLADAHRYQNALAVRSDSEALRAGYTLADEILRLSNMMHDVLVVPRLDTYPDLPQAEEQGKFVFEVMRAFIMDQLPLFRLYLARLIEAANERKAHS